MLKQRGFVPLEAGTVGEAIAWLAQRPHWVLLDLMLPDGCGSQIVAKVKENGLGARICVITGCTGELLDKVSSMGADQILTKPIEVERLISLLEN